MLRRTLTSLVPLLLALTPTVGSLATDEYGEVVSSETAGGACSAAAANPHWNTGHNGVIYKVKVSCMYVPGMPSRLVEVRADLGRASGGKCRPNTVASGPPVTIWGPRNQAQYVPNGGSKTFYVPSDSSRFTLDASYYGNWRAAYADSAAADPSSLPTSDATDPVAPSSIINSGTTAAFAGTNCRTYYRS